jgi:sugar phosphate isomerase/epimerase
MKNILCYCVVAVMALFITSSTLSGATAPKKHMGVQVYSVKGFETDVAGSLKTLADEGYVALEIANYDAATGLVAGMKPAEFAALAQKNGLEVLSSHSRAKIDTKDEAGTLAAWGKVFDDHKLMGCKYVILPMNIWAGTVEGLKAECELLNKIGDEANKRGIKFGYHNHNIEFAKVAKTDQYYEDFLITNTDPAKVMFEMDVYWTTVGGQDPVAYLKKYPTRIQLLHIKDEYVVGATGKINYKDIFTQFYANGYNNWFVEMEDNMTPEQRVKSMAMMDAMKKVQEEGGSMQDVMAKMMPKPEPSKDGKPAQQGPPPGFGKQDPQVVAQKLKESLEGLKQSADFLLKSDFVK